MRNYYQMMFLAIVALTTANTQASIMEKETYASKTAVKEPYTKDDVVDFIAIEEEVKKKLFNEEKYKKGISSMIAVRCPDYFTDGIPQQQEGKIAVRYKILEDLIKGMEESKVGMLANIAERSNDNASKNHLAFIIVSLMEIYPARDALIDEASKALTQQLFIDNLKDHPDNRFNTSTENGQMRVRAILSDIYGVDE